MEKIWERHAKRVAINEKQNKADQELMAAIIQFLNKSFNFGKNPQDFADMYSLTVMTEIYKYVPWCYVLLCQ